MTSIIGFMTTILFCSTCHDSLKCDGEINCPWHSPHDEVNCGQPCSSSLSGPIPCDCSKPENMTCAGAGRICYRESGKLLVLFYLCKRDND